ncbi:hypothetical protein [Nonomuraea rhizosphaerae]|uniref:hypothetical protein n=1 Tax=Nonomuraea rhizosphaerae TaxID=2665663 RepID=UPI001C5DF2C1|nr:hypothetical protein [Nonomuraea rhizosphaerae]
MQDYDRIGQPFVIPAPAAAGALLDAKDSEASSLLSGLGAFNHAQVAGVDSVEQAEFLVEMITRTGLDPWRAHVAALADLATCPILTLDPAQWTEPSRALERPLHVIGIIDPGR